MDNIEISYVFVYISEVYLAFLASWFDPETPSSQKPELQHSGNRYYIKEKTVSISVDVNSSIRSRWDLCV